MLNFRLSIQMKITQTYKITYLTQHERTIRCKFHGENKTIKIPFTGRFYNTNNVAEPNGYRICFYILLKGFWLAVKIREILEVLENQEERGK